MTLLVFLNLQKVDVTLSDVLVVRRFEGNIFGWAKLGIFVSEYDKMKMDKNGAF